MNNPPPQPDIDRWHKYFAIECNNTAWDLFDQEERTPAETQEMLHRAHAAAYHWGKVGTRLHAARARLTLAHAHSLAGNASIALGYAQSALDFFQKGNGQDWDLAFAHLEMALAAYAASDRVLYDEHIALARKTGRAIAESGDRQIVLNMLEKLPRFDG